MSVPLLYEISSPGRRGYSLPAPDVPVKPVEELLPAKARRTQAPFLPEVSEVDVVRHFTNLSRLNYGVDTGFYPLGSCTMKYNPKIGEAVAELPGFTGLHPYQPEQTVQGALTVLWELERDLCEITGMSRMTLQPAAGAHGELTGLLLIAAYHTARGDRETRRKVLVPDSAHGTNPASAALAGFEVVAVKSDDRGLVDLADLRAKAGRDTAALMLTNPNTLGLFEEGIVEIAEIVHGAGALLYYDGANLNAILGKARPGDMGFDVVHLNLHKTFATPHGGGGPGSGPVGVKEPLVPFLPVPLVERGADGSFRFVQDRPQSIGKVKAFYGNFLVALKAYAYLRAVGPEGLERVSEDAVLNANYLRTKLRPHFAVPFDRTCMHEFVLSGSRQKERGVHTLDMAKRLLDLGFHAPTIYFPLIVEEALMIEPTETESKETLDAFAAALLQIAREAEEEPELVRDAPHYTPVRRLDEARAARQPDLRWKKERT
ncbi:MAG TPA: aminomethyl-transferring glycine dehydrogenase subunit GcvPB [Firmicutes bacterium]|nr:aminomethyl-transferring glycine dehydrogenase subunit GcvPB [Bacillota bacterium]